MSTLRRTFFRALHAEDLPPIFWVLWAGAFLNRLGNFVVPFLAIYLTEQRGASAAQAGLLVSLYGLGALLASLTGGALADRLGRRLTMVGALVTSALSMGQFLLASGGFHLALSVVALGFFGELYRPAMQAMVADLVPEGAPRLAAFGALYWAANLGFACSTAVAGLLAAQGFRALFLGDALTTLGFAAVTLLLLPETRPQGPRSGPVQGSWLVPFRDRSFLLFLAANTLLVLCFFQVSSTLPLAVRAAGMTARDFGFLMSINGALIVVLQPLLARWIDRLNPRAMAVLGALLIGSGFASHALATTASTWALGVILWTLGEIVVAPRISALVADLAPVHLRGSYQGALQFGHATGAFLGPLGGGWLLLHLGAPFVWSACGAAGLLSAALFSLRSRRAEP
jgi:MFS family permease